MCLEVREQLAGITTMGPGIDLRSPGLVQGPLPVGPFHWPRPQLLRAYSAIY